MENIYWTYLLAITLLTLTPGVDTLLVIRNTSRGGVRDRFAVDFDRTLAEFTCRCCRPAATASRSRKS